MTIPTSLYYFPRRVHIFWTALVVYAVLKTTQTLNKLLKRSSHDVKNAWSRSNTRAAKIILRTSTQRRGLWIKCCQYVAARSDALPEEYTTVLSKSLDDCPPTRASQVLKIVNAELAKSSAGLTFVNSLAASQNKSACVDDLFDDFNPANPIASASIAQVHVSTEKLTGQKVVLKVQHPGIESMLLQDLIDLKTLLRWIAGAEPKYDMRPLLDAWIEMVPLETDFDNERANLEAVRSAMLKSRTDDDIKALSTSAYVPRPLPQYSTTKLFVMEYIDGCKISDLLKNKVHTKGVDRLKLVDEISKSFGVQLFLCDTFSGDPHSGNFLVSHVDQGGVPVLLDFGICVKVSTELRLGFARLILAACRNDSYSLVQALADIGLKLNRADPASALDMIKYLFRTTSPREESMKEQETFNNVFKQQGKKDEIKKNELENPIVDSKGKDFTSLTVDESEFEKMHKERGVVDAFPGHLVFFFRSLGMLRGLAVSLDVRHSYLTSLRPFAEHAVLSACPPERRLKTAVYQPVQHDGSTAAKETVAVLETLINYLYAADRMIGLQVAVYQHDKLVINMAAGRKGLYNARPVTPDTLFGSFSTTKGLTAILFAYIQDKYGVQYDDLVTKYWPEYGQNGKESTTIAHILTHTAGLAMSFPDPLPMTKLKDDWRGIIRHFETAKPAHPPGAQMQYHALSFGWLVAGLVMHITGGRTYQDVLLELTEQLGIQDECFCGTLPADLLPDVDESRVARLSSHVLDDMDKGVSLGSTDETTSSAAAANAEDGDGEISTGTTTTGSTGSTNSTDSDGGVQLTFEGAAGGLSSMQRRVDGALRAANMPSLQGVARPPAYLLDLNFYNHPVMRAGFLPSANGHFSARALARLYGVVASEGRACGRQVIPRQRVQQMCQATVDFDHAGRRAWAAGLTVYDGIDATNGTRIPHAIVGHGGVGGSFAFAIPEHGLSLAVTVNKLNAMSAAAAFVVAAACSHLAVPVPESYAAFTRRARDLVAQSGSAADSQAVNDLLQGSSRGDLMKILVG